MAEVRLLERDESRLGGGRQDEALSLARRFPGLLISAREVAASVLHGVHGRRRAGFGENFWQFRPFDPGESKSRIDWRRSARDDRLYVREREWEAAHTAMVWIDLSPSMHFVSKLALQPKVDRAVVLGLAVADVLIRGGERVGLMGLTRPLAARNIVERLGEVLVGETRRGTGGQGMRQPVAELPPAESLPRSAQAIVIGDFLSDPADVAAMIDAVSARGARGHLLMIADPVEETFPFSGHTELIDVDSPARLRIGDARAFREDYMKRLNAHREAIRMAARTRGWTLMLHRTDRPASEALLSLRMQLDANLLEAAGGAR